MLFKKTHFTIYIIFLTILFVLQACEKKEFKKPSKKHNTAEIDRLISLGYKHNKNEEFDSSYYYYSKAKHAADVKKDTSRIIHSLGWIAQIQSNQGDYSGSETTITEALPFLKNTKKYPNGAWNIYNALGNNYMFTSDYDNALIYYNKALNLKTDQNLKAGIQNNIAMIHMYKGNFQHAKQILFPLTLQNEVISDPELNSKILDNLGNCYYELNNTIGLAYLRKALKIRKQNKDNWGITSSYFNLYEYYKKSDPNLSNKYAQLAYEKATRANAVKERLQILEVLIKNSMGDHLKEYSLNYIHINDSINKIRQKAKNQFAKIKYDSKKEKEENIILKEQKIENELLLAEQRNKSQFITFISIIGLVLTFFLFYFLKGKNKKEKIQTSYNTEIRIAKKLHDELANDVYQTIAFAETQDLSSVNNKETLLNNLDTIYSRTRNISKENSSIETGINYIPNLMEMMSGYNTDKTNVLIHGLDTINWSSIENTKKITLYRVLQELLVNMKKHSKSSLVVLSFKINKNVIHLNYTDNGLGVTFDKINLKSGLQNMEKRILAIKGTITFDTKPDKGFKVNITFPK
jgi:tetratricopeptide (TPR) repeat protein